MKNNMEQIDTILKYPYPKPKAERVSKSLEAISSEVYNFSKLKQQKLDRVAGIKKAKEVFIEKQKKLKREALDSQATERVYQPKEDKDVPLSNFQMILKIQANDIDNLVNSMDSNNDEMKEHIQDYEIEMEQLSHKKTSSVPGAKVKRALK